MEKRRFKATKLEQLKAIVRDFKAEIKSDDIDPDDLTDWAIKNKRMVRKASDFFRDCKKELVQAIKGEHFKDDQGREVPKSIAVRYKKGGRQKSLWIDTHKAKPKRMRIALSQQRRSIEGWCRKHAQTTDSYNDNNPHGAHIERADYDFNKCLTERQLPLEYPEDKPEGDD